MAAPMPKMKEPIPVAAKRPSALARCPVNMEERAAGIRMVETTRPCCYNEITLALVKQRQATEG